MRYIARMPKLLLVCGTLCLIGMVLFVAAFALGLPRLETLAGWLTLPYTLVMGILLLAVALGGVAWVFEQLASRWPGRKRD